MGLGPMEISGSITRVMDFANMKQADDNRVNVDQANFQGQMHKEINNRSTTVERGNDANNNQKKFDAKEKGSNEYYGDGGRRRSDENRNRDGFVRAKTGTSTFDIRI